MAKFELTVDRTVVSRTKITVEAKSEADAIEAFLETANHENNISKFEPIEWEPWDDDYDVIEAIISSSDEADQLLRRL